jgi:2-polyprenyl-3-methyl-5-hydroxy-6-metoxy-1,4-benzoquinol methylase
LHATVAGAMLADESGGGIFPASVHRQPGAAPGIRTRGCHMDEKRFFDNLYKANWKSEANKKDYLYIRYARPLEEGGNNIRCYPAKKQMDALLNSPGEKVLDCACGAGELGIWLALNGKDVCGFDFSEEAVKIAVESARLSGVAGKARFEVMDVGKLGYADDSFDILTGNDCLHHLLNQPGGVNELARVLKPGGRAFFVEPLAWNPLINLLRFLNTARKNYHYEHFLTKKDIESIRAVFGNLVLSEHVVVSSFSRIFAPGHAVKKLNSWQRRACLLLRKLDNALLRFVPAVSHLSSMAFMEITKT